MFMEFPYDVDGFFCLNIWLKDAKNLVYMKRSNKKITVKIQVQMNVLNRLIPRKMSPRIFYKFMMTSP